MDELIDKWDVVSKLISLENEYQFFKGFEFALSAEKLYSRICELEIQIGKTQGIEVVRCKDCKHWQPIHEHILHMECQIFCGAYEHGYPTNADDFCSYGERRTE